jgi:pteridine reductase
MIDHESNSPAGIMPMNGTKEKGVALVTGAARRVGRAIALRLADEGFDVAFTYLTSGTAAGELRDEIQKKGRSCLAISADLTDSQAAVEKIFAQVAAKFSRLEVLVNSASLYQPDAAPAEATSQIRRFWASHVESPLLLSRAFSPMLQSAGGSIINMLDLLAERPMPGYLAYCASKAGLWNLTLGLAREMAPRVRVNGIAPGVVEWPADLPADKREQYLRRVPMGRAGTPEDVAGAVTYLSIQAQYVTGQILRLDGGRSIA